MAKRTKKTGRIVTVEAEDGMGAVTLIDNANGYTVLHQDYCHAAEWNWNHQLVIRQAEYLGYQITGESRERPPALNEEEMGGEIESDEDYQLALAMDPGDHDYQLGLGI